MKKIAKIYKWILLSIILQVLLLCYLEFFFLGNAGGAKATEYETGSGELDSKEITLPADAQEIKVSNDGTTAAFLSEGELVLENIQNRTKKRVPDHEGWNLDYFSWLPDRAMVVCAYSKTDSTTSILITTYDFDNELERSYPEVKSLRKGSRTTDIGVSPYTNVIYFQIRDGSSRSRIYRFNIMDNIKHIMNLSEDSTIREIMYTDTLVYENGGKIYTREGRSGRKTSISLRGEYALLGADSEDKVYLGKLNEENEVTAVYFGMTGKSGSSDWEHTSVRLPVTAEKLLIGSDGTIFELDEAGKCINDIITGKRLSYTGDFIQMLDNYIVAKNGRKLQLSVYKQKENT